MNPPLQNRMSRLAGNRMTGRSLTIVLIVALVQLALIPLFSPARATAASPPPCLACFAASSAADLIALRHLDLAPLGLTNPYQLFPSPVLGSTRSGLYGGPSPQAAARAGLAVRDRYVLQTTTSTGSNTPVDRTIEPLVDKTMRTGAQRLHAEAVFDPTAGRENPPEATATLDLSTGANLLGHGRSFLWLDNGAQARTNTALVQRAVPYAASASSTTTLTGVTLFNTLSVRVTRQAALRVTASTLKGSSTVDYTPATVLVSTAPGSPVFRPLTGQVDLIAPLDATGTGAATRVAREAGAPLLPAEALGDLLTVLGVSGRLYAAPGKVAIVRLSPGRLTQQNLGQRVHALAAALRVQVLVRSLGGGPVEDELIELVLGSVEALVEVPGEETRRTPSTDGDPAPSAPTHALRELAFEPLHRMADRGGDMVRPPVPAKGLSSSSAPAPSGLAHRRPGKTGDPAQRRRIALILIASLALIVAGRLAGIASPRR